MHELQSEFSAPKRFKTTIIPFKAPSFSIPRAARRMNDYCSPMIPVAPQKFDVAPISQKSSLLPSKAALDMSKQLNRQNKLVNWEDYNEQENQKKRDKGQGVSSIMEAHDGPADLDPNDVKVANPFLELDR